MLYYTSEEKEDEGPHVLLLVIRKMQRHGLTMVLIYGSGRSQAGGSHVIDIPLHVSSCVSVAT